MNNSPPLDLGPLLLIFMEAIDLSRFTSDVKAYFYATHPAFRASGSVLDYLQPIATGFNR